MNHSEQKCQHSPERQFAWSALNEKTGKADILCVACCDCGEVLQGAAEEANQETHSEPPVSAKARVATLSPRRSYTRYRQKPYKCPLCGCWHLTGSGRPKKGKK